MTVRVDAQFKQTHTLMYKHSVCDRRCALPINYFSRKVILRSLCQVAESFQQSSSGLGRVVLVLCSKSAQSAVPSFTCELLKCFARGTNGRERRGEQKQIYSQDSSSITHTPWCLGYSLNPALPLSLVPPHRGMFSLMRL